MTSNTVNKTLPTDTYIDTRKTKRCTKCGKRKTIKKDFYASKGYRGGYQSHCKSCNYRFYGGYDPIKHKAYYERNRERMNAYSKKWAKEHPECAS